MTKRTTSPFAPQTTLSPSRRPGTALVVVVAALSIMTLMFIAAAKMILVQQKSIELNSRQLQANWLATAGIQRAAARLADDAKYQGETWDIPAKDFGGRDGGTITIRVEQVPAKPDRRAVRIQADYPSDPQLRARVTRDVILRTGKRT
jgi:hypothetical protein